MSTDNDLCRLCSAPRNPWSASALCWACEQKRADESRNLNEAMNRRTLVHAAHCCKHWCKYGEDGSCPVVTGEVAQKWPCHDLGCDRDVAAPEARSALDDAVSMVADELKTTWGEQARAEFYALRAQLAECKETRTTGTALTMLAQREQEERLAQLEAAVGRLNVLVAPAPDAPRTCATCRWLEKEGFMGEPSCESPKTPNVLFCTTVRPDSFGCIHHAPVPPGG